MMIALGIGCFWHQKLLLNAFIYTLVWRNLEGKMRNILTWRCASTAMIGKFETRVMDQLSVFSFRTFLRS